MVDPDHEMITAWALTAGNSGDAAPAAGLLVGELSAAGPVSADADPDEPSDAGELPSDPGERTSADIEPTIDPGEAPERPLSVYGEAAYGAGELLDTMEQVGVEVMCHVQGAAGRARRTVLQGRVHGRSRCRHRQPRRGSDYPATRAR